MIRLDGALTITSLYEINLLKSNFYLILAWFRSPNNVPHNERRKFFFIENSTVVEGLMKYLTLQVKTIIQKIMC